MCDCYKIGGPWIAEDPDCPVHGRDAQMRKQWADEEQASLNERIEELERRVAALEDQPDGR
jgi:hypothetical protein